MRLLEIEKGTRYGFLVVTKDLGRINGNHIVKALCDCGVEKEFNTNCLRTGNTKSCGCQKNKHIHGKSGTRIYNIYCHMKERCYNKKSDNFIYYGKRGIGICEKWLGVNGFERFYNWSTKNGYSDKLTIDRIDNDKGYSPDNCRWVNMPIQVHNQRKRKTNTSGYTGVSYEKRRNKWRSLLMHNYKFIQIGEYKTIKEAVYARNEYIKKHNLIHKIQVYKE